MKTNDAIPDRPTRIRGCTRCGASIRIDEGTWACPHCGEFYDDPEFEVTAEPGTLYITFRMPDQSNDSARERRPEPPHAATPTIRPLPEGR